MFVGSDQMAMAVMDVLRIELGLRIPQDVSVVGFDNVPQATWGSYQLTTVEQPVDAMIDATVSLLRAQWDTRGTHATKDSQEARAVTVPCRLVVRNTTR